MSHLVLHINYLHANVLPDKSMDERQDYMKEYVGSIPITRSTFVLVRKNRDIINI